jgi:two-component system, NarL family, response regulator NreC
VLKDQADSELVAAVRVAATGHPYLNPQLGAQIRTEPGAPVWPPDRLTDRELEVLKLDALGYKIIEIACELHLSSRTV